MDETRQIDRALHDEHMHVAGLLRRLSDLLGRGDGALVAPDETALRLFAELRPVLDGALERHFRFEEDILFPRLDADGADDLTGLLREEHDVLLPQAARLRDVLAAAMAGGLDPQQVVSGRRLGLEFASLQIDHIEREEMALPPALESAIEDDEDRRIAMDYMAG